MRPESIISFRNFKDEIIKSGDPISILEKYIYSVDKKNDIVVDVYYPLTQMLDMSNVSTGAIHNLSIGNLLTGIELGTISIIGTQRK